MKTINDKIVKTIKLGITTSLFLITLGLILKIFQQENNILNFKPYSFNDLIFGLYNFHSYDYLMLGIFILILTPIMRVVITIKHFLKEKDYVFVKITSITLIILIISFLIGIKK